MKLADLNINLDVKMLREFGIFSLFGFGLIGCVMGFKWDLWQVGYTLWGLGGVSFALAFVQPKLLKPLFIALMVVAFPIGFVISNVILAALFYGLFTPIALVFKMVGRDALNRRIEPDATSYWASRDEENSVSQRFKQY